MIAVTMTSVMSNSCVILERHGSNFLTHRAILARDGQRGEYPAAMEQCREGTAVYFYLIQDMSKLLLREMWDIR